MARANLNRRGIVAAMAERYWERKGYADTDFITVNALTDFGALVAREVRRAERDRRLQQLELQLTKRKARS